MIPSGRAGPPAIRPSAIRSMTAFASRRGERGSLAWDWDLRSVNGRSLELRPRLPDGIDGLEPALRAAVGARVARGSVSLALRLDRGAADAGLAIDEAQLDRVLSALDQVQKRALALGVTLGRPNAADVLAQRGVLAAAASFAAEEGLLPVLLQDLDRLLDDFVAARAAEGAALARTIGDQLDAVERLAGEAEAAAAERRAQAGGEMRDALARVAAAVPVADEARVAQELAFLAVKGDVTEEIDRLRAHLAAGRALLAEGGPVGRRLDFLLQELNREANTLMSKGGSLRLTRAGLDLKAVIDQMREQVQNVE